MKQTTDEKLHTEGIQISEQETAGKFQNFWYHYKWHTIGIVVALIILTVCLAQACSKKKEDVVLLYAGPFLMTQSELSQVSELLTNIMPADFDGNGEKLATLSVYHIYSREQILEIESAGDHEQVDRNRNTSEMKNYETYIKTGESSIYFLDPALYATLRDDKNQPLQKLSDVLTEVPEGALGDDFGVRLGDTELYRKYAVLRVLPADTVICLSRPYVLGKNSKADQYEFEKRMFAALVGGTLKE